MARYKQQLNVALERLDQGLARLQTLIKRGDNSGALRYMDEDLRELYVNIQDLVNIEPENNQSRVGFLGGR